MDKIRWLDEYCNICGKQINSWEKRCNKALAYQKPTCEECMAKEYGKTASEFRYIIENHFGMRPCMGLS